MSDLGAGVHLAGAAAEGALLSVEINLSSPREGDALLESRRGGRAEIVHARTAATAAAVVASALGID